MKNVVEVTSFDDMVDALADVKRRKLLVALLDHNPKNETPVVTGDSESESDVAERLIPTKHYHLPKLADYGFIEWDRASHEVSQGPNFDEIRPLIELLDKNEDELPADWT